MSIDSDSTAAPVASTRGEDSLLLGLIGAGIQRSLTPAMHEAEGRRQGMRLMYRLIDLDRSPEGAAALPRLIDSARLIGFAGLNVTFPCKQAVIPLLDSLSDDARELGAVNTVVFDGDGRATGHNTDGSGWAEGFRRALPDADLSNVVLLGAGGAGAAIAHAVMGMGARRLSIVDVNAGQAARLAQRLAARHAPDSVRVCGLEGAVRGASGIIHATPTGMDKLPGLPLPSRLLAPSMWVSEIVYFPLETELLRTARAVGCRTVDGGGMAVWQAVGAFALFTGRPADATYMDAHFRRMIAGRRPGDHA